MAAVPGAAIKSAASTARTDDFIDETQSIAGTRARGGNVHAPKGAVNALTSRRPFYPLGLVCNDAWRDGLVRALTVLMLLALTAGSAAAQIQSAPQPLAPPTPIPAPQDVAYPGVMKLFIDATDLERRIYRVRQTIPVTAAGPMTLLYSQWLPGSHAPWRSKRSS